MTTLEEAIQEREKLGEENARITNSTIQTLYQKIKMSKRNRLLGKLQGLIKKRDKLSTEIKELEDKLGDQNLVGEYIKVPSSIGGDTYISVMSQRYENFKGTDLIKVKGPTLRHSEENIGKGVYICFTDDNTTYIADPKKIEVVSKEHFITALQGYLNWAQENQELIIKYTLTR